MRKRFALKNLLFGLLLCSACALGACNNEEVKVNKDAEDTLVQGTTQTTGINSLFCKQAGIESVKENYAMQFANGAVENGVLITSGAKNSNLYYARPVDLKESNGEIISFEIPYTDTYQTGSVEIQVTDMYDEYNSFTVRFARYTDNDLWSTVSAKNTNFNSFAGFNEHGTDSEYTTDGMTFAHNNFSGKTDAGNYHYAFNLCYDTEENQVYLKLKGEDTRFVCDFDDTYFTANSDAFAGFTAESVYVNIKFTEIVKTGAVFVRSIGTDELSGAPDYSVPTDNIKIDNVTGNIFYDGAVGYKYLLPKPIENDFLMGEQKVSLKVIKAIDAREMIVTDYVFTPTEAGDYEAIYTATDIFGNKITRAYPFTVTAQPNEIVVEFEETTYEIGDEALLPEVTVYGGSGDTEYSVEYVYDGKTYDEISKISFRSTEALQVKVTAEDSIGYKVEKTETYEITKKALCYLEKAMPKSARIGERLLLPKMFAYDYIADKEMSKSIYVNGAVVTDGAWTVKDTDGETLTIEYYANKGESNEQKLVKTVNIFDQANSYFLYDDEVLSTEVCEEYTTFKAINAVGSFTVSYPYALSVDLLNIYVQLGDHSRYEYTDVTIADYVNGESVSFRLKYDDGGLVIAIRDESGEFNTEVLATAYLENVGAVNFYYNNKDKTLLSYRFNDILKFDYTDEGKAFEGFKNGGAYVSFKADTVGTDAELRIVKLGNQEFYARRLTDGDVTAPEFAFLGNIDYGEKRFGDTLYVSKALGFDVLSGEKTEVKLTLYSPSGVVYDAVVLGEEKLVEFNEYGAWTFVYESMDSNYGYAYYEENVTVKDDVLPEITVNGFKTTTAKLGSKLTLPKMTATDNIPNTEVKCNIVVCNPELQYVAIEGNEVVFDKVGTWKIVYHATDASGNVATKVFTVVVK